MSPKYKYTEVIDYQQSQNINDTTKLSTMLDSFQILFAYNSGVIENKEITYYDVRKIFANGKVINFTGDLRTLYEITNQKNYAEYLINKIINKEPLSVEFIKYEMEKTWENTLDNASNVKKITSKLENYLD